MRRRDSSHDRGQNCATIIAFQVAQLAEDLPTYETNLRTKIRALV
jgi:hypothetical protein